MVIRTCTGRPRSVMNTGPLRAAFFARLVSWLNSRLESVVMVLVNRAAQHENSASTLKDTRRARKACGAARDGDPFRGLRGGLKPWEELRALGGRVYATPGESVIKDRDFEALRLVALTRRRASAPRRSSRA